MSNVLSATGLSLLFLKSASSLNKEENWFMYFFKIAEYIDAGLNPPRAVLLIPTFLVPSNV